MATLETQRNSSGCMMFSQLITTLPDSHREGFCFWPKKGAYIELITY